MGPRRPCRPCRGSGDPVAVFTAEVVDVAAGGLEDPQPEQPEHGDQGEVVTVGRGPCGGEEDLELQVGQSQGWDSGGTVGRRTCSAGECSKTPSMTQVRQNPATTDIRRDTVEGWNRRTSCSQRRYSSRCGRVVVNGSRSRSAQHVTNPRRSDSVCTRDWPLNRARYAATANRNTGGVVTTTPEAAGSARGVSMPPVPDRGTNAVNPYTNCGRSAPPVSTLSERDSCRPLGQADAVSGQWWPCSLRR